MTISCNASVPAARLTWIAFLIVGALWIGGCSNRQVVREDNKVVRMPTHEFTLPTRRLWFFRKNPQDQSTLVWSSDSLAEYRFLVRWVRIDNPERQTWSVNELAADYFRNEQKRILEVEGGRYRIENISIGEEEVGGEVFQMMKYYALTDGFQGRPFGEAFFYVLAPYPSGNKGYLAAEFKQMTRNKAPLIADSARKRDFLSVLTNLKLTK